MHNVWCLVLQLARCLVTVLVEFDNLRDKARLPEPNVCQVHLGLLWQ